MDTGSDVGCVGAATDILGDKWTPQLLRHFFAQDKVRFCQLQDNCKGINPRTLSARLTRLETSGIIQRLPTDTSRHEYAITQKGKDLLPILQSMRAWSEKYGY
jgi:DNA-binding HxlR family transcriptional regulator